MSLDYPESTITVKNSDNSQLLTVLGDNLSVFSYKFTNLNLNDQWADVQNSRYWIWAERTVSIGINKYWGYITDRVP